MRHETMRDIELELVVRIAVCSTTSGRWQATFPLSCDLDLLSVVRPWMGGALRLEGKVTVQGARETRRRTPSVSWSSSGKHDRFGLPKAVGLVGTRWSASLVYGPRVERGVVGHCGEVAEVCGWGRADWIKRRGGSRGAPFSIGKGKVRAGEERGRQREEGERGGLRAARGGEKRKRETAIGQYETVAEEGWE